MDEEFVQLFRKMVYNTDEIVKKLSSIDDALYQIRDNLDPYHNHYVIEGKVDSNE